MGAPADMARSWHLTILAACISPSEPPMVLKSCAKAKTVRPLTMPYPVTTPSPGTSVWSMPKFTQRCSTNLSSSTKVPSSKRRASLSRAVSLPVAFTFSRPLAPPPLSIFFSRALLSSIFSLFVTAILLFVFWNGLERRLFPLAQLEQHAAGGSGVHEGDLRAARAVAGLLVNEPHAQ